MAQQLLTFSRAGDQTRLWTCSGGDGSVPVSRAPAAPTRLGVLPAVPARGPGRSDDGPGLINLPPCARAMATAAGCDGPDDVCRRGLASAALVTPLEPGPRAATVSDRVRHGASRSPRSSSPLHDNPWLRPDSAFDRWDRQHHYWFTGVSDRHRHGLRLPPASSARQADAVVAAPVIERQGRFDSALVCCAGRARCENLVRARSRGWCARGGSENVRRRWSCWPRCRRRPRWSVRASCRAQWPPVERFARAPLPNVPVLSCRSIPATTFWRGAAPARLVIQKPFARTKCWRGCASPRAPPPSGASPRSVERADGAAGPAPACQARRAIPPPPRIQLPPISARSCNRIRRWKQQPARRHLSASAARVPVSGSTPDISGRTRA